MARALLALYSVTGDRQWLSQAEAAMTFIGDNFRDGQGAGLLTSKAALGRSLKPRPQRDENVMVARTANLLFHYTDKKDYQVLARQAMRYLAASPVVYSRPSSSVLLADLELGRAPLHLTITGPKDDANARSLFQSALRYPSTYERVEWWDPREGPLPNPDVQYPQLHASAAFICTDRTCSSPIFKPEELKDRVEKLARLQSAKPSGPLQRPTTLVGRANARLLLNQNVSRPQLSHAKLGIDLGRVKADNHRSINYGNGGGHISQSAKLFDSIGILGDVTLRKTDPFLRKILFRPLTEHSARLREHRDGFLHRLRPPKSAVLVRLPAVRLRSAPGQRSKVPACRRPRPLAPTGCQGSELVARPSDHSCSGQSRRKMDK